MVSGVFARRPVRPLPQYTLIFSPTNTELFVGNVIECLRQLEQHAPNCSVSEMVARGYRIQRATDK